MKDNHRILFEPGRIGKLELKNRFYMAPMGPSGMTDADGAFMETAVDYYSRRARGGVGLIITGGLHRAGHRLPFGKQPVSGA